MDSIKAGPNKVGDRKKDHIDLAFRSSTPNSQRDQRFFYEPVMTTHPAEGSTIETHFLGKRMKYPIWVSSMTGGTQLAKNINKNLAKACNEFGLGMGLGSCRKILTSDEFFEDFNVRKFIGDQPLYANLGIAQIIDLIKGNKVNLIAELLKKLEADGLIIHVNPIQEWIQPEGDAIHLMAPIDAISEILNQLDTKLIVKEVGQGMGPTSLSQLMKLPVAAIEFGAFGGTNFAKLEALRIEHNQEIDPICFVGHTVMEMIEWIHQISASQEVLCKEYIISGSVRDYLDGYYYNECCPFNSVYGQAAGFLKHAMSEYEDLASHVEQQVKGYAFASRYLRVQKPF